MPDPRLRVLDLFSGAGGMSLGFYAEGCRTVGAVDIDEAASKTFEAMFGPREEGLTVFGGPSRGDISSLPIETLLGSLSSPPDLIVGGPPCQSFSRIGRAKQRALKREEEANRDSSGGHEQEGDGGGVRNASRLELYRYFLRAVRLARPMAFVIENVPGMVEGGGIGTDYAYRIAHEAAAIGYQVRYFLLNAVNFGVPQLRWRLFFIGFRNDLGSRAVAHPPTPTHGSPPDGADLSLRIDDPWFTKVVPAASELPPPVTVMEALGDLPLLKGHLAEDAEEARLKETAHLRYRRPPGDYASLMRSWPGFESAETTNGHWYRFNPRDYRLFARMAQGERYPEALGIAYRLLEEELEHLRGVGAAPAPGSQEWKDLVDRLIPPYRNDAFHDKWRKLVMDQPSWTLTAHLSKDTYSHIHYDSRQARTITIREAARLQSFPDGFEFSGNCGDQFRQIGNAVPPLLARAVARQVLGQLRQLGVLKDTEGEAPLAVAS